MLKETAVPLHLLGVSRSADVRRWDAAEDNQPGPPCVRWVSSERLAAAIWTRSQPPLPLEQAVGLGAIHRRGDVLPMRFGASLADEDAVCDLLRRRQAVWLDELDRLAGTGEIGLRIELLPGPAVPAPESRDRASGIRCQVSGVGDQVVGLSSALRQSPQGYLAARRAQYQAQDDQCRRAELAAEDCLQTLAGLYRQWRRLSPEPAGTVRLAFLVQRGVFAAFAQRLAGLRARRISRRFTFLGPWPPYSFAGQE
ncbi:MAG: GvpL/GvpF family gas vesicle protein [Thermoguttaceae bacterium]|jgi:hypothetical protein